MNNWIRILRRAFIHRRCLHKDHTFASALRPYLSCVIVTPARHKTLDRCIETHRGNLLQSDLRGKHCSSAVSSCYCRQYPGVTGKRFLLRVSMPMHTQRDIIKPNRSACPSHSGIVSKWVHISSNAFHHLVEAWLVFFSASALQNSKLNFIKQTGMRKLWDFKQKSPFISETVRDRPMVTMDH